MNIGKKFFFNLVEGEIKLIKCPSCGNQIGFSEKFCGNCGTKVIKYHESDEFKEKVDQTKEVLSKLKQVSEDQFKKIKQGVESSETLEKVKQGDFKRPDIKTISTKFLKSKKGITVITVVIVTLITSVGFTVAKNLNTPERFIQTFVDALNNRDKGKIVQMISSKDNRLVINETSIEPILNFIDKNPSFIAQARDIWEAQSEGNFQPFILNFTELEGGLLGGKYLFEILPYYLTIYNPMDKLQVSLNGVEDPNVYKTEEIVLGPLMPGVHDLKVTYEGEYVNLSSDYTLEFIEGGDESYMNYYLDIDLNPRYIDISSKGVEDVELIVDGLAAEFTVGTLPVAFGPISEATTVQAKKEFPWGTMLSEEFKVSDNYSIEFDFSTDSVLMDSIIESTNSFMQNLVKGYTERKADLITNADYNLAQRINEKINDAVANEYNDSQSKLVKLSYPTTVSSFFTDEDEYYAVCEVRADYEILSEEVTTKSEEYQLNLKFNKTNQSWDIYEMNGVYNVNIDSDHIYDL